MSGLEDNYCTGDDIKLIYGSLAVSRWADLDGVHNTGDVEERIEWACNFATAYVNARLLNGPYEIPFVSAPLLIINITAMYAGILLYDGRQIVSSEDRDAVSRQRKDFDRYIQQILKGQLKLIDNESNKQLEVRAYNAPFVVE